MYGKIHCGTYAVKFKIKEVLCYALTNKAKANMVNDLAKTI